MGFIFNKLIKLYWKSKNKIIVFIISKKINKNQQINFIKKSW